MTFRSLRWRIASFYAVLLLGVIALVAAVLTIELHSILLDEARAKVDRVGTDIAQLVRGDTTLSAIGDSSPALSELTATGALDHWAGPTTFVEITTPDGYSIAKSTNMGGATFTTGTTARSGPLLYRTEDVAPLGDILVRDEYIHYPGVSLIVAVGESLAIFDDTVQRIRDLLIVVVLVAVALVIAGSFAIASSALEPIGRLSAAMNEIRSDRLSRRLGMSDRRDELGSLAHNFDAMLDRLEDGFARERQFISDASHELKTPLTVINANAQMLERWASRDPQIRDESVRAIRDESAGLASMVNGMLLLAKAESGEGIPREPVVLEAAIADAVSQTQGRAAEKDLALRYDVAPDVRGACVLGDAGLLRQLFTNLIDNAIKFTERGGIDVSLARADGGLVVKVADTGIGIDDGALERVFERFFRADASHSRAVPGTGLGLAIVRSIARIHDGTVAAGKRAGGGTVLSVTLPELTPLQ